MIPMTNNEFDMISKTISTGKKIISNKPSSSLELEVRFTPIKDNKTFLRIHKELEKIAPFTKIFSTDYRFGSQRDTVIDSKKTTIIKDSIRFPDGRYSMPNKEYDFKFHVSIEHNIPSPERFIESDFIRNKNRTRFSFFDNSIFIDLTQVSTIGKSDSPEDKFELEVEVDSLEIERNELKKTMAKLLKVIQLSIKLMQDTEIIYTNKERETVVNTYNSLLKLPYSENLNHKALVTARNLKKRDCVYGGIIGGKTRYSVTPKAEGHRKQLMITEDGFWLVYPPFEISCLFKDKKEMKNFKEIHNTIYDGENIPKNKRTDNLSSRYMYLPFDTLIYNGEDLRNKDHFERLSYVKSLRIIDSPIINIFEKDFIELGNTHESFINALKEIKNKEINYLTDGFMFTPINTEYKTKSDKLPVNKRILTKYPDICKFKPWEELTIDFKVTFGQEVKILVGADNDKLVEFNGDYQEFDQNKIVNLFSSGIKNGDIVEFAPIMINQEIKMYPKLIRSDKTRPNREDIAKDIWNDINHPLKLETLEGKTFDLVFQYHNQVKRELFRSIPEGYDLIDIGYGKGGDIPKQEHFHKILGIEPNLENFQEAEKRFQSLIERKEREGQDVKKYSKKLKILNCSAEDTELIVEKSKEFFKWSKKNPRGLCISFMLSLSFFWESPESLEKLKFTIESIRKEYYRKGGTNIKIIFLTIESSRTKDLISKKGKRFKLGPASFSFSKPNKLHINIQDTIVNEQDEYLVNLEDLDMIDNLEIKTANEEKFLSNDEKTYTELFVMGSGDIKKSVEK